MMATDQPSAAHFEAAGALLDPMPMTTRSCVDSGIVGKTGRRNDQSAQQALAPPGCCMDGQGTLP
jgi:hypothetical protein